MGEVRVLMMMYFDLPEGKDANEYVAELSRCPTEELVARRSDAEIFEWEVD